MWYYTENGEQRGPVTDADFETLVQTGKVESETLVWREGQADWQPYRIVKPTLSGAIHAGTADAGSGGVICAECGKRFPADDVMQYSGVSVCAACKPIFVQKLREGVNVGGAMNFASFGLRFGAYVLDAIILYVAGLVIGAAIGGVMGALFGTALRNTGTFLEMQLVVIAVTLGVQVAYHTFFLGKFGATPGKMACKIKVVNGDGSKISYLKGLGRFFGYWVSSLTLLIGFFMMLWDEEKRTLHDRICNTRVIQN